MLTAKFVKELLMLNSVAVNEGQLSEILNSCQKLPPRELFLELFQKLGYPHLTVKQVPIGSCFKDDLPGAIFLNGQWSIIKINGDGKISIETSSSQKQTFESLADVPTSVVLSIVNTDLGASAHKADGNSPASLFKLIKKLVFAKPGWVVDITIATIVINLFAVVSSLFAMQVYDRVVPTLAFQTLYSLVVGVTIIYFTDFLLKISRARLLDRKSSELDKELSEHVYDHLLSAQTDKLPNQLGTLTAQISGVESVRQFFTSSIVFGLVDLPFSLLFLVTIYFIGGPIAGAYLTFFLISITIGLIAQKRSQVLIKKLTARSNEKMGVLVDTIRGLESIKVNGYERRLKMNWSEITESVSDHSIAQKSISNLATSISQSLGSFSYAAAILIGVHQIEGGNLTMGAMIACSILGGRVLGPVGQAVSYLIQFENVQQSAQLVDKFLEVPADRDRWQSAVFPTTKPNSIELIDLKYCYEGSQVMQVDVANLKVQCGERIAILGKIGSGKSTLLKMLAGIYRQTQGLIKFDSAELWSLDKRYINRHVGYLPQNAELFKGTLLENIVMDWSVSDTRVLEVINQLKLNQISDRNEKGLDLLINEGGSGLSGGQKQMVALARVFVQSPSIWLLDEPTSSIDQELQSIFRDQLLNELSDTDTLIFSTHNPKLAMELATRIIIMEDGKVVKDVPTSQVELKRAKVA